jgi:hypothetical protein
MDLAFTNNQTFQLSLNIAAWAPIYDLTSMTFRMQLRTAAGINPVIYSWSSSSSDGWLGTIAFNPSTNLLMITAPYADMLNIEPQASPFVYDLQISNGTFFKDLTGGTLTFYEGITH